MLQYQSSMQLTDVGWLCTIRVEWAKHVGAINAILVYIAGGVA